MSTPIRLVRNDGNTIDLICTTLTMNVQRGVTPITMPFFGGSRLGFDMNLPSTVISMEGIIADDDKFSDVGAKAATAVIDFDSIPFSFGTGFASHNFATYGNILDVIKDTTVNDATTANHAVSLANVTHGSIYFTQQPTNFTDTTADVTDGSNVVTVDSTESISVGMTVTGTHIPGGTTVTAIADVTTIKLSQSASGGSYTNGTLTFSGFYGFQGYLNQNHWVGVYNSTTGVQRSATEIATDFAALINLRSVIFGMTATVIDSPTTGATNTAVKLVQNSVGKTGNTSYPSFSAWPSVAEKPHTTQFSGGKNNSSANGHSAGDRVAELYAVLCNSNNGGIGLGNIVSGLTSAALSTVRAGGLVASGDKKYGDYIIGLQIPFTSKINDNSSLFYMPTGAFKSVDDKTADNAEPVGTEFSAYDGEYTGIKGTIADATFVQLGGEPIYSFTINFVPIDWII